MAIRNGSSSAVCFGKLFNGANQAIFKRSNERGNNLEHKKAAPVMRRISI